MLPHYFSLLALRLNLASRLAVCGRLRPGIHVEVKTTRPANAVEAHTHKLTISVPISGHGRLKKGVYVSEVSMEELWAVLEEVEFACSACGDSIQPTTTVPLLKEIHTHTQKEEL